MEWEGDLQGNLRVLHQQICISTPSVCAKGKKNKGSKSEPLNSAEPDPQ